MKTESDIFAERVSQECRRAAEILLSLQDSLSEELGDDQLTDRVIGDLQVLDTLTQTLTDLGRVFETVAVEVRNPRCRRTVPDRVLAAVRQTSLRLRLEGADILRKTSDVDLFDGPDD
ncbi:hypothetical protein MWU52_03490 [Jannaschia sp. S6380]|uniref:hypothetical protein n=1 Tax=Jannaschia sp. S6380 TaxID=2926408 RepID=UPI001FF4AD9A|nr:hypothetical protein [Jannaschia sp. S6380]MCK0166607.1 hypothetical protein [Jannaschia sp. S6380]